MKKIYLISLVVTLLISSCNGIQEQQEKDIMKISEKQIQEEVVNNQNKKEIELSDDETQMLEDLLNF